MPASSEGSAAKAILNLRGSSWYAGWRSRWRTTSSAAAWTSTTSSGCTPASGDRVTLRTALPHASRVVSPARAQTRIADGTSLSGTKWNWKFCRVVTWPQPRE